VNLPIHFTDRAVMIRATSQNKKDRQRRALAREREHSEVRRPPTEHELPMYEPNRHSGGHHHRQSNLPRRGSQWRINVMSLC
jgi:hypothetical protein